MAKRYEAPTPANVERDRVEQKICTLIAYHELQLEDQKLYARWAGGYVEMTDDLFSCICPADLLGVPCEWDEILDEGCNMIRLCKSVSKYTYHECPDVEISTNTHKSDVISNIGIDSSPPIRSCGHIHSEIEISCRYIATVHMTKYAKRYCRQVLKKGRFCSLGHDFESARQQSRDEYETHRSKAREAGSRGQVKFGWTW